MSAKTINGLLETIKVYKDECFLSGNVGDILHLRQIEQKLLLELKTLK